jgi:hypothetical protein
MALLAYLVIVASLMTSLFIGYEWIATSSSHVTMSRVAAHASTHMKTAKLATKAKLASSAWSTPLGIAESDPTAPISNQNVVSSNDELAREQHRVARARQKRLKMIAQRLNDRTMQAALGQTPFGQAALGQAPVGRTALGYAAEPAMRPVANLDRLRPD